jgi:hypothetical protein
MLRNLTTLILSPTAPYLTAGEYNESGWSFMCTPLCDFLLFCIEVSVASMSGEDDKCPGAQVSTGKGPTCTGE